MKTISCRNGHERTDENTYTRSNGSVECRECMRAKDRARYPSRRTDTIARATQWGKDHPDEFKKHQAKQELRPEVKQRRKDFYEATKSASWRKFSVLKSVAKGRGIGFEIAQADYELLIYNKPCLYCDGSLPEVGHGTDRQDHKLGYTLTNVVPCCETCNEKKGILEGLGLTYPRTVEILMEILGK